MTQRKTGIFWFKNDLRLHDNPALMRANALVDELLCVYIVDNHWHSHSSYSLHQRGQHPHRFLRASLTELDNSLGNVGQGLMIVESRTVSALSALIEQVGATDVFRSNNSGWYENQAWAELLGSNVGVNFHSIDTHTLFEPTSLPFSIAELPSSFTKFKNAMAETSPLRPIATPYYLVPPPSLNYPGFEYDSHTDSDALICGGESRGLNHLRDYFSTEKPMFYKQVRNAIDGWDNSCKLSPWLASGCLSVREVMSTLSDYEANVAANESTYWIYFELLWREYFQWYAHKYGRRLFLFDGIKRQKPLTSFYHERFKKWLSGTTPYPLVNACMNELRETGYLSNRGRQIVASCLVHELSIDWRYGAAYFEQVLIDYDVASNWGNWQYLAGVGADARSTRQFNLEKQAQQFDPHGRYTERWKGNAKSQRLDSVDAADWPVG